MYDVFENTNIAEIKTFKYLKEVDIYVYLFWSVAEEFSKVETDVIRPFLKMESVETITVLSEYESELVQPLTTAIFNTIRQLTNVNNGQWVKNSTFTS